MKKLMMWRILLLQVELEATFLVEHKLYFEVLSVLGAVI